jgi:hypothetical protein
VRPIAGLAILTLAACSNPASRTSPPPTSSLPPSKGYSFTGKLIRVAVLSEFQGKAILADPVDVRWVLEFEILTVFQGSPPAEPGNRVAYAVHSPARSLPQQKIGAEYRVTSSQEGSPDKIPTVRFEGP